MSEYIKPLKFDHMVSFGITREYNEDSHSYADVAFCHDEMVEAAAYKVVKHMDAICLKVWAETQPVREVLWLRDQLDIIIENYKNPRGEKMKCNEYLDKEILKDKFIGIDVEEQARKLVNKIDQVAIMDWAKRSRDTEIFAVIHFLLEEIRGR